MSSEFKRSSPDQGECAQTRRLASAIKAFYYAHKKEQLGASHCFHDVARALPAGEENVERGRLQPSSGIITNRLYLSLQFASHNLLVITL